MIVERQRHSGGELVQFPVCGLPEFFGEALGAAVGGFHLQHVAGCLCLVGQDIG